MSEVAQGPRSSVFTTMRFSKRDGLFLIDSHLARMRIHAEKLRIDVSAVNLDSILRLLHEDPPQLNEGLLRIECTSTSEVSVTYRPLTVQNEHVDAITLVSPTWPKRVSGTKHGAWNAYVDARQAAENRGADLALLVHEYSIVDGDRCTPIVLDDDGVLWVSDSNLSVDSITFGLLKSSLNAAGYHIQHGKLNERIVARCVEAVAVGSGVGVLGIESLDGEQIGVGSKRLFAECASILKREYETTTNWTVVWE